MQGQLNRILEAVGQLQAVDTSSVGPTAQVIALENVMRDDVARPSMAREAALGNAPLREGPMLRVPVDPGRGALDRGGRHPPARRSSDHRGRRHAPRA